MSGWFAVKRGILDHPIFHKRHDRLYAWMWMLKTAAWQDTEQDCMGKTVTVKRGQIMTSFRQMEDATGVSIKVLRGLIDRLKTENAIGTDTGTGRIVITIRNYDKYQHSERSEGTPKGTARAQQGHTKETSKQIPPSEGASAADPVKVMFDSGKDLLMKAGKSRDQAGKLLGKWRGDHGVEAVISALGRAQREGAIDPVSFIEGCFRFQQKNKPKWQEGAFRALSPNRVQEFMHGRWEHRGDLTEAEISEHPKFIGRAPAYAV